MQHKELVRDGAQKRIAMLTDPSTKSCGDRAVEPRQLASLFTDDGVLVEPGVPAQIIGRAAILAENVREKMEHPDARTLEYKPNVHGLEVHREWAVEWMDFDAVYHENLAPGLKDPAVRVAFFTGCRTEPGGFRMSLGTHRNSEDLMLPSTLGDRAG